MKNDKTCPLCGELNDCKAGTNEKCWCFDTPVPKALLKLIPLENRGKSCVCKNCVEIFNNSINK